ncbi:hypothetical protein [Coleofasciculus sp.]
MLRLYTRQRLRHLGNHRPGEVSRTSDRSRPPDGRLGTPRLADPA